MIMIAGIDYKINDKCIAKIYVSGMYSNIDWNDDNPETFNNCLCYKYKNEEDGLFDILNSYQEEVSGVIKEIKEDVHLPNNKVGHEIILISDKEEKIVYLPIFSDAKQIKINQKLKMIISKSFIISFEVIDDEK